MSRAGVYKPLPMYSGHCARGSHLLHVVPVCCALWLELDLQDAELCNTVDNLYLVQHADICGLSGIWLKVSKGFPNCPGMPIPDVVVGCIQ